jgi:hypothetical protein
MIIKKYKNDSGFVSIVVVLFLVTLGLMSLAASMLIQSEGVNIGKKVSSSKADYAFDGAVNYAMRRIMLGAINETNSYTIGDISIYMDTTKVNYEDANVLLSVTSSYEDIESSVNVYLKVKKSIGEFAGYISKTAQDVEVLDENGNVDETLMETQATDVPDFSTTALYQYAQNQSQDYSSNTTISTTGYPNGSFWHNTDSVNVTYVNGDLTFDNGSVGSRNEYYGIFVVTGNVTIPKYADVMGIIYMPNEGSILNLTHATARVVGGVVGHGYVMGTTKRGNSSKIQHDYIYMDTFDLFRTSEDFGSCEIIEYVYE